MTKPKKQKRKYIRKSLQQVKLPVVESSQEQTIVVPEPEEIVLTKRLMLDTSFKGKLLTYDFNISFELKNEDVKKWVKETLTQLNFPGYSIYVSNLETSRVVSEVDTYDKILYTLKTVVNMSEETLPQAVNPEVVLDANIVFI